ncbi:uncharacterized protein BJX67DRAFT_166591 [Aspergillus lucknowensis]|uniref:Uncharacterized protein n=1 Tax=Aspergillus lucknowensis TaxID=176173 RepID=A0ABR4M4R1_9EURO
MTASCIRGPFPDHLTTNAKYKQAALTVNQCTTAMALLGRLTRKLLTGVASSINVFDLHLGRQPVPTKLVPGPDATTCPHTVVMFKRLFVDETWILDTTGCQYGYEDILVPFDRYIDERECRNLAQPVSYDATETEDLDYFATLPFMNKFRTQRENMKRERRARLRFAEFVDANVSQDILQGSNVDFDRSLDTLMSKLKMHMSTPSKRA